MIEKQKTRELFLKVLAANDCTPKEREDGFYEIVYRDWPIVIQINEDRHSVSLLDLYWHRYNKFDFDKMVFVKETINRINASGYIKLVYGEWDDDYVYVSSVLESPFDEEISNLNGSLSHDLNELLSYRKVFSRSREEENKKD